ncbi:hypothetical protein MMC26_005578 [Xylographa opegraphella]|nr:hypothetical protein [Xylographa opegraphella]
MPEIGEVARIVNYIRQHLVGRTLAVVKAQHDENVYGKVGTSATEFEKALAGKKVLGAKQQGKYFWLEMSSPPHPLMHFGMAGWFKIKGLETAYYKPTKPVPADEWPPKYWKFTLETLEESGKPVTEAAFVDFRRFARIRLIDCPAEEMRNTTPLKENGPDPVADRDILTVEWLAEICAKKHIPIKALLLDQANVSGIGNWVGDEIMYDAKIHPEQYSNTLSAAQITQLHKSIHYVCSLSVETLADSSKFPEEWLFKHRWGKGKKDSKNQLPNGARIVFMTVGGRTSAVVPSVQKKTGKVAGDVKREDLSESEADAVLRNGDEYKEPKLKAKAKAKGAKGTKKSQDDETVPEVSETKSTATSSKRSARAAKQKPTDSESEPVVKNAPITNGTPPTSRKRKPRNAQNHDAAEQSLNEEEPKSEEPTDADAELPKSKKRKPLAKTVARTAKKPMANTTKKRESTMRATNAEVASAEVDAPARRRSARVSGGGA